MILSRRRLRVQIAEVPAALAGVVKSKRSGENGRGFWGRRENANPIGQAF